MFAALAFEVERRPKECKGQGLANTAWAFAAVSLLDEMLLAVFQREAQRRMSEFDAQKLANASWAFATVSI